MLSDTCETMPKYCRISESIKAKINSGVYPVGERLPSCRELSTLYNATLVTVSNAMQQLEKEGYVRKTQRRGMFAAKPLDIPARTNWRNVGLAMHHRGDLVQNVSEGMVKRLESRGIYTLPLQPLLPERYVAMATKEECIKRYIADGIDSLVMDGSRDMPFSLLLKYHESFRQMNFIMNYEAEIDIPGANVIIFDAELAGRMAAEYLLKAGRENFLLISFDDLPEDIRISNAAQSPENCRRAQFMKGMQSALHDAGIPEDRLALDIQEPNEDENKRIERYCRFLKNNPNPGIFALGDFRCLNVYKAAAELGKIPGRDFSILGLYNTHWTQALSPTLSSISIEEDRIVSIAADCIIHDRKNVRIKIPPKIIVRET
ncbi:MAG: GntR family transcriptional regulator [Victivallales bacterium]|nr:GntR family transcriptional regulator [Victivallales bacterium]